MENSKQRPAPVAADEPGGGAGQFPVVGIGASAGGLEALTQLLSHLPPQTGMAFLIVQHLDPTHESRLPELLARATAMTVSEATQGVAVRPDHVYVIPPNANLAIASGILQVTPRGEVAGPHLPLDRLFRSLAKDQGARAIAVVLSGSGSDGTLGLAEIRAAGGITFAQDEETAKHASMPRSAVHSGAVDFVLPPEEIARRLAETGRHPYLRPPPAAAPAAPEEKEDDEPYKQALALVRAATGVDFSEYRDTTLRRRIQRRMMLEGRHSLADYLDHLRTDAQSVEALYGDLLINVTSFFRDPEAFEALKTSVFPRLLESKTGQAPLRVWAPGCSTGQEVYSLAITLVEFLDGLPARPSIQIFGTDLGEGAPLDRARSGIYPESIEGEVSAERLRRFFSKEDHTYRIDKRIRDLCVFARQNLTADPPFSRMDLISCRNVLIYMSPALHHRLLPIFHYALNPGGYLLLGSAETVGEFTDLFEQVDRQHRIYRRKPTAARHIAHTGAHYSARTGPRAGSVPPSPADFQREADRLMLERYSPPGVLVDDNFEILQFRGRTSQYLEAPAGAPTTNLLKMAREGLFVELRRALKEAQASRQAVRRRGVRLRDDRGSREIAIEVVPVAPPGSTAGYFLVLFQDPTAEPPAEEAAVASESAELAPEGKSAGRSRRRGAAAGRPDDGESELTRLRQELAATKEYMESLLEQHDAANEELQSANEEILSANEELQTTNEELETAKEELQSANEELTTVNEQLQHRNLALNELGNDLTNLLASTTIPIVMVSADLRIRMLTAAAKKAMHFLPTDVGRPLGDITAAIPVPDLEALITEVAETVQVREREVQDGHGHWYSLRIHPYRTADNKIDGAVLVFLDIDDLKRAHAALAEKGIALQRADRRKDEFLATLGHELRNPLAPIRNAAEVMRLASANPRQLARARDVLDRQLVQVVRIVDDLLDTSRIVQNKIALRKEPVKLASAVETALESTRSQIEAAGHTLRVELPEEPIYINADAGRLAQVFSNLLNNAAKFTDGAGRISITAQIDAPPPGAAADGAEWVSVRISDTGIGIAPALLPRVFEMFAQGDRSLERRRGGLGIGLTLVRSLVEMHGGTVSGASDGPGKGSEFTVHLPVVEAPRETSGAPAPVAPDRMSSRRVLVVDDNRDAAESLVELLQLMGHQVRVAHDGLDALAAAAEFRPELALVDIGLPEVNGYEVARRLRARGDLGPVVLVALTGYGQEEDRRRSHEAGFDDHFVKPIAKQQLEALLARARP